MDNTIRNEEKERIRRYQEFFSRDLEGKTFQLVLTYQKDETQFSSVVVSNADWNRTSFTTVRGLLSGLAASVQDIMKNAFPEIKIAPSGEAKKEGSHYI